MPKRVLILFFAILSLLGLGGGGAYIACQGAGVLGISNGVPWGWDIVQFVFWIGLGHAGTLISAILLITGQHWRRSIARPAELMTLCAVVVAGLFPLLHVGRVWMLWLLTPLPLRSGVWANLCSPLLWDAAAVSSYFLLSLVFYLLSARVERAVGFTCEQRASGRQACFYLAAILTPLVITVHSVVGSDFAVCMREGWHGALLPPYFVCGALLSGMAMVILIALARRVDRRVLERLARLMLAFAWGMGIFYGLELMGGHAEFSALYALMLALNVALPSLLLLPALRTKRLVLALLSVGVLLGMWLERVEIIVLRSMARPSAPPYSPSWVDAAMLIGSVALFLCLYLSFSPKLEHEEEEQPDVQIPPFRFGLEKAAFIGGGLALSLVLTWSYFTQGLDTAGAFGARPSGAFYQLPAIFVACLFGAGLAVAGRCLYLLPHQPLLIVLKSVKLRRCLVFLSIIVACGALILLWLMEGSKANTPLQWTQEMSLKPPHAQTPIRSPRGMIPFGESPLGLSAEKAYARHCAACHGAGGRGKSYVAQRAGMPSVGDIPQRFRERELKQIRSSIEVGRGAMPAFQGRLSPEEVERLILYLQELP